MVDEAREKAVEVLCLAEQGKFVDEILDRMRPRFSQRDNAFILELVKGVLRNRSYIDYALNVFSSRPVEKTDAETRNVLRLGAYQLLFLDRVPPSAAVDTSVEIAKHRGRKPGYVNGLLRALVKNLKDIPLPSQTDMAEYLSILYSHPVWIVKRWVERYGRDTAERLLSSDNVPAPLTVRTNLLRTSREALAESLIADGAVVKETVYSPYGIEIISSPGLKSLTAFENGWFIMQDEAAQLVSMILNPRPSEIVLDACAAPGGKATHIAELMGNNGRVIALEADAERARRICKNSKRLGIDIIETVIGDAMHFSGGPFDRILVDAPCSGLGVLKRHPDGRWTKKEAAISAHQALQRGILDNCASLLRPGGVIVYSTCTTEPEENEEVIEGFVKERSGDFLLDDPKPYLPNIAARLVDDKGYFRTWPAAPEMDGFFAARIVRKK